MLSELRKGNAGADLDAAGTYFKAPQLRHRVQIDEHLGDDNPSANIDDEIGTTTKPVTFRVGPARGNHLRHCPRAKELERRQHLHQRTPRFLAALEFLAA